MESNRTDLRDVGPTIETERLLLRPFVVGDLDAFAAMVANQEVQRFFGGPRDRVDAWRQLTSFLGHGALRGWTQNAVVEKATGRFLGRAGLWYPEGWPGVEVGWVLAREAWGHGYATEAGAAWRDWAFAHLGIAELISLIHPDNAASIRVAERVGSRLLRDVVVDFQPVPVHVYGQSRPGG